MPAKASPRPSQMANDHPIRFYSFPRKNFEIRSRRVRLSGLRLPVLIYVVGKVGL